MYLDDSTILAVVVHAMRALLRGTFVASELETKLDATVPRNVPKSGNLNKRR